MKKSIIGGIITVIIGGTGYTISQSDVVSNFAQNTGMSQQQAKEYVDSSQKDLESFSKIGQSFIADGNSLSDTAAGIDCVNYTYEWESPSLSCNEGLAELKTIGSDEVKLGDCYVALDTDLGSGAKSKISECIADIDAVNASYSLPMAAQSLSVNEITYFKNSNLYNKSVLQATLKSN